MTKNFISNIAKDHSVWIGGFNQTIEKIWIWEDENLWDYSSWGPNHPMSPWAEAYVLNHLGERGLWNDAHDKYETHFVCQANEKGTKNRVRMNLKKHTLPFPFFI